MRTDCIEPNAENASEAELLAAMEAAPNKRSGFSLQPRKNERAPQWLLDLPVFIADSTGFLPEIKEQTFQEMFGYQSPYQTCGEESYKAPLLVVPETPGEDRSTPKAYRINAPDICFTKSYYGYSAGKHPDAQILIALLQLILHSNVFRHFCLMQSSRVGASYRTFLKGDIDQFPFPEISKLDAASAL